MSVPVQGHAKRPSASEPKNWQCPQRTLENAGTVSKCNECLSPRLYRKEDDDHACDQGLSMAQTKQLPPLQDSVDSEVAPLLIQRQHPSAQMDTPRDLGADCGHMSAPTHDIRVPLAISDKTKKRKGAESMRVTDDATQTHMGPTRPSVSKRTAAQQQRKLSVGGVGEGFTEQVPGANALAQAPDAIAISRRHTPHLTDNISGLLCDNGEVEPDDAEAEAMCARHIFTAAHAFSELQQDTDTDMCSSDQVLFKERQGDGDGQHEQEQEDTQAQVERAVANGDDEDEETEQPFADTDLQIAAAAQATRSDVISTHNGHNLVHSIADRSDSASEQHARNGQGRHRHRQREQEEAQGESPEDTRAQLEMHRRIDNSETLHMREECDEEVDTLCGPVVADAQRRVVAARLYVLSFSNLVAFV